ATFGEAHLKGLIEKTPDDYFLWNRLGNLYKIGRASDLALETFQHALTLNEHDIETHHSIAQVLLEREEKEEAARYYHQVLLHARPAPAKTPRSFVRDIVRDALQALLELHLESNKRIPLFPAPPPELERSAAEGGLRLTTFDLSKEKDRERLVEWWATGK